jgi:hypothetical protein
MASSPIDPSDMPQGLRDGVIASILGALAMTARLLLSETPVSAGWVIRRVSAAAITAALVGYGIQEHIQSPGLRMAVVGAAGYSAPECCDFLIRWIKSKGESEIAKVSPKKNAKRKLSAKRKR